MSLGERFVRNTTLNTIAAGNDATRIVRRVTGCDQANRLRWRVARSEAQMGDSQKTANRNAQLRTITPASLPGGGTGQRPASEPSFDAMCRELLAKHLCPPKQRLSADVSRIPSEFSNSTS